jgi:cytochrome oxidase complex assembly protein 1
VRIHRQWFILGGASIAFLIGGSALGVSAIEKTSRGPAFHLAATCLRVNAQARQQLGVITGYGLAVSGPVVENADGTGHANLQFDVIGSWLTGHARVQAHETNYHWHWDGTGSLVVAGKRYRLHLDRFHSLDGRPYSRMCAPVSLTTRFH